jgi:hypothetical protein
VAAAAVIVLAILLKIVLMLVATPGMIAPAATATKPAIKAYSMRSWPRVSFQILSFQTRLVIRVIFYVSFLSPRRISSATTSKLSPEAGTITSVKALRSTTNSTTGIPFESWTEHSTLGGESGEKDCNSDERGSSIVSGIDAGILIRRARKRNGERIVNLLENSDSRG